MKKVLLVLALVAVYGVSMAMSTDATVVSIDETATIVVVDADDKADKKDDKKATKSEAKGKACSDSEAKGCSDSKAKACSDKKAAKKDCSSSCSGK